MSIKTEYQAKEREKRGSKRYAKRATNRNDRHAWKSALRFAWEENSNYPFTRE